MAFDADAVARVQACAFNAHDLETVMNQYADSTLVIRDGQYLGEGRDVVQHGFEAEWHEGGFVQVRQMGGQPVLVECFGDPRHPQVEGVIRMHHTGDFLDELHIDHDPALLAALQ